MVYIRWTLAFPRFSGYDPFSIQLCLDSISMYVFNSGNLSSIDEHDVPNRSRESFKKLILILSTLLVLTDGRHLNNIHELTNHLSAYP